MKRLSTKEIKKGNKTGLTSDKGKAQYWASLFREQGYHATVNPERGKYRVYYRK